MDGEERREVVAYLTDQGMSTRAIAPIVATAPRTITNDRKAASAGGQHCPPAAVVGLDGKAYPPARPTAAAVVPAPIPIPSPVQLGGQATRLRAAVDGLHLDDAGARALALLERADPDVVDAAALLLELARTVPTPAVRLAAVAGR